MSVPLTGIFVPHIVPYDARGRIDEDELPRILRWLGAKGVTGFYPDGSMGEFIRLSSGERRGVVTIVAEEAGGRPIPAGAAEPNVDLVLDMCRFCAGLGCRAISITGPYDFKLTEESIQGTGADRRHPGPPRLCAHQVWFCRSGVRLPERNPGPRRRPPGDRRGHGPQRDPRAKTKPARRCLTVRSP